MALQFHNVKGSKFFTRDPYCFRSSLRVPSAGSRLAKGQKFQGLELQGSRAPWLQDSKVAGFHGQKLQSSRNPRLQVSMVSKLSELRVPGFQSRNPLLEPLQECLARIPCRKPCRNFSGHLNKTCRCSLSFVSLVCIILCLMCGAASCVIKSWNHGTLKNLER